MTSHILLLVYRIFIGEPSVFFCKMLKLGEMEILVSTNSTILMFSLSAENHLEFPRSHYGKTFFIGIRKLFLFYFIKYRLIYLLY